MSKHVKSVKSENIIDIKRNIEWNSHCFKAFLRLSNWTNELSPNEIKQIAFFCGWNDRKFYDLIHEDLFYYVDVCFMPFGRYSSQV
jgi:hypothetical protein